MEMYKQHNLPLHQADRLDDIMTNNPHIDREEFEACVMYFLEDKLYVLIMKADPNTEMCTVVTCQAARKYLEVDE